MPDIDPAALSRPSTVTLSTPVLSTKSITVSAPNSLKPVKTSQIIPARIDLEPLYTALKHAIGGEQWKIYKESTTEFFIGRLNQVEFSDRIDVILADPTGEKLHLHNQLIAAIYGNVTRDLPDAGLAPWVSANDKPAAVVGPKPVTGDAAERRLKGDVMQLPSRDRRRIKDLAQNDFDPYESIANVFGDSHRRQSKATDVPPSAGGINKMNFDLEIRKRYAQPLAVESGEFPDSTAIEARMLPYCYEAGLVSGHSQEAAHFMSVAAECFAKEVLASIFSKTRSNGPGESGASSSGAGTQWIQTYKYRRQLSREEDAYIHGELSRDKSGLLPVEAKAASERGSLGMADIRIALEMSESGISRFPVLSSAVMNNYREGELELWNDYTWLPGHESEPATDTVTTTKMNGGDAHLPNGHAVELMDIDSDIWWDGAADQDMNALDSVLDSCLAVGS